MFLSQTFIVRLKNDLNTEEGASLNLKFTFLICTKKPLFIDSASSF